MDVATGKELIKTEAVKMGFQAFGDSIFIESPKRRVQLPLKRRVQKVGRNEPCPCGSGLKFKHCHLAEFTGTPRKQPQPSKPQEKLPDTFKQHVEEVK